jgi:hypothetical protein
MRYGAIDAALLLIGAYDPAWFMSKQHMNPEAAVRAFGDLGWLPQRSAAFRFAAPIAHC